MKTTTENPSPTENVRRNNLTGGVAPVKPPRSEQKPQDEWESKLLGNKPKSKLRHTPENK